MQTSQNLDVAGVKSKVHAILSRLQVRMQSRISEHVGKSSFYGDIDAQDRISKIGSPLVKHEPVSVQAAKAPAISRAEEYLGELKKGGTTINGKFEPWFDKYSPHLNADPIHQIIMDGIESGKSPGRWTYRAPSEAGYPAKTIADDISQYMGEKFKSGASRIARTETARYLNLGTLDRYGAAGIESVRVHDGDGCDICAEINGQVWTLEESYDQELEHPNCKRTFSPIVPGYDRGPAPDASPMPENDPGSDSYMGGE